MATIDTLRRTAEQAVREAANLGASHLDAFRQVSDSMQRSVGRTLAKGENQHRNALERDRLSRDTSAAWQRAGAAIEALRAVDAKAGAEVQAMAARLVAIKSEGR